MNHFAPHAGSQFEGYYSKFDLPSGARLALIICTVPNAAKARRHMVSFTYVPHRGTEFFTREIFVDDMQMIKTGADDAFELRAGKLGTMRVAANSVTTYDIRHQDFSLKGTTRTSLPWSTTTRTPESLLVHLPLPLHWHVHSPAAKIDFELSIPSFDQLSAIDKSGSAVVHQEKNWANSFPSAHIWIQARKGLPPLEQSDKDSIAESSKTSVNDANKEAYHSICVAGGQILGTEAYLLGYRSSTYPLTDVVNHGKSDLFELDFRPPIAMRLLSMSPTLTCTPDFANRTFSMSVCNWRYRLDVTAKAPPDTFFPLSAPFADGHRENFLAESFSADIAVKVYQWQWGTRWWDVRGWWASGDSQRIDAGKWTLKEQVTFENGSLEFGGGYYDFAGSQERLGR